MSLCPGVEDVGLQSDGSKCNLAPQEGGVQNRVALSCGGGRPLELASTPDNSRLNFPGRVCCGRMGFFSAGAK
jgi:hypothetical protein